MNLAIYTHVLNTKGIENFISTKLFHGNTENNRYETITAVIITTVTNWFFNNFISLLNSCVYI